MPHYQASEQAWERYILAAEQRRDLLAQRLCSYVASTYALGSTCVVDEQTVRMVNDAISTTDEQGVPLLTAAQAYETLRKDREKAPSIQSIGSWLKVALINSGKRLYAARERRQAREAAAPPRPVVPAVPPGRGPVIYNVNSFADLERERDERIRAREEATSGK